MSLMYFANANPSTASAGQVYPGLAELHALCDRRDHQGPDFSVLTCGSLSILTANTRAARIWADEHLPVDRARWGRHGTVIEQRYVQPILDGLEADGYSVGV
jgi:hypothetical protein